MAETPVITRAQVAALLGISPATLVDRVGELRRTHGFPQALPGSGGRRYARALVLAWINRRPAPAPNAGSSSPSGAAGEQAVADCEAILLGRARAMAAG